MVDLLELQKSFILTHLKEGDVAADFTMGNGHDTQFLCETVGESGHVYAFDIQQLALDSTKKRLTNAGLIDRATLILDSHSNAAKYIDRPLKASMFNLGYLPGSGKKEITTMRETTMPAVEFAIEHTAPDGIVLIAIYPGHEEGDAEGRMLYEKLGEYPRWNICCSIFRIINSPTSPYFYIIEKKEEK